LALLQDVADGEVWYNPHGGVVNTAIPPGRDCGREATELRRAVPPLVRVDFDAERLGSYPYVLTAAGREALAAGGADDAVR
jgi:hypothetical protein